MVFTAYVAVHDGAGVVTWFEPGDEVPGWAVGRVGDHCVDEPSKGKTEAPETAPRRPVQERPATNGADFTGGSGKRRRG